MALSHIDTAHRSASASPSPLSIPSSPVARTLGAWLGGGPRIALGWAILFAVTAANFLAFSLGFVLTRGFPRAFRTASARIAAFDRRAALTR